MTKDSVPVYERAYIKARSIVKAHPLASMCVAVGAGVFLTGRYCEFKYQQGYTDGVSDTIGKLVG